MDIEITNVYQKEALTNIINRYGNFSYIDAEDIVKQIEINKSNTPIKIYDIPDYLFDHMYRICEFKKINKMEKHQFKPFDQVLVRNTEEQTWKPNFYSFEGYNSSGHVCTNDMKYTQCIPYNENTAHLLGTNQPYKEPEPKVWYINSIKNGESYKFTNDEFEHFIKTAVLNNKDITDFNVRYVNN